MIESLCRFAYIVLPDTKDINALALESISIII